MHGCNRGQEACSDFLEAELILQASVEHDSAAAAVLQLLSNRLLPEVGQLPVLLGAIPMLERQELPPLFGVEGTQQLLMHLQVKLISSMEQGPCPKSSISKKPAIV